ncbi:MAG: regulatory protein RecX [Marinagarivorans sp.]|nr:regulatory protein RecX [Marinagarivorans sp.]
MLKSDTSNLSTAELNKILLNKGIELLARREHSADELRKKLTTHSQKKMVDQDVTEHVLSVVVKLQDLGYQSDERFTQAYCRSRLRKGYGRARIVMELSHKGIAKPMIEMALSEVSQMELAPEDVILRSWQKKFRVIANTPKDYAKQYRFLQYRGFSGDQIAALFSRLKNE